jgi:dihydroneopterin aldolase
MPDQLVIKGLEFQGHIGITPEERQEAQPIGVDLELDYLDQAMAMAARTDDITHAVDYAAIVSRVAEIGQSQEYALVETLGHRLVQMLFSEFSVSAVRIWVRKLSPPIKNVRGSVGVRIERQRHSPSPLSSEPGLPLFSEVMPARFLIDHFDDLQKGNALDVAAGRGRNTLYLAAQGFNVEAIDWDEQGLAAIREAAADRQLPNISVRPVDLEANPTLLKERYDTVIVFFYLQRSLFPSLLGALKPGGVLMYETFLIDNHRRRMHPRRREFCLEHNELLGLSTGLRVIHYDEGEHDGGHGAEPSFTAQLIARKE